MTDSNKNARAKHIRVALSLILVGLYIAGLIAMIAVSFQLGLYLWVISTAGGIGLLYWIRVMDKRESDADRVSRGMSYGEPDDPLAPDTPVAPAADETTPEDDAE